MKFWYESDLKAVLFKWLLSPFSLLFWGVSILRHQLYQRKILDSYRSSVPVIIVGNLSVGGNGKTPVVIWLIQQLRQQGIKVGVISRGYGSQSSYYPRLVRHDDTPVDCGDEPVLIAKRTGVPVCISPNRQHAIEKLIANFPCDVIISDDGLQHYKLQRDIEIVVIDADRGFGNGFLLPAGPLRELPSRLETVNLIIANGGENANADAVMFLQPQFAINLLTNEHCALSDFSQREIVAIAGIGNPQRFFTMLRNFNFKLVKTHEFADHEKFEASAFTQFPKNRPLFMTEKDAVKCIEFAQSNWWYVPVETEILGQSARELVNKITQKIQKVKNG